LYARQGMALTSRDPIPALLDDEEITVLSEHCNETFKRSGFTSIE